MRILNTDELKIEKDNIIESIIDGDVFIYPTDTIYGIGCNALRQNSVEKIRRIKQRPKNPFSVLAPSKQWISKNFILSKEAKKWVKKLPGPYTLVLKLKKKCVAKNVAPGLKNLGVRIPKHWFSKFVNELKIPIITTSVNKSKEAFMTSINDLDKEIKNKIDFIIYEGKKQGRPSKIIDLTGKIKIKKR